MRGIEKHGASNIRKSDILSMASDKESVHHVENRILPNPMKPLGTLFVDHVYKKLVANWVAEGLRKGKQAGKSQVGLAEALGVTQPQIPRLLSGERSLRVEEIPAVERYLDLRFPFAQISGIESAVQDVPGLAVGMMPVRYRVAAGVWMEADTEVHDHLAEIPFARDPAYPASRQQYAVQVIGDSMNKVLPDGCFAIVVATDGERPQHNDLVIVKRTRDGLIERTIKRFVVVNAAVELRPESDNPRHKPIPLTDHPETTIEIEGIVIGRYERFGR